MQHDPSVQIERYCAVADDVCRESNIKFKGTRSCFLAYPFAPGYMESMEELRRSLRTTQNVEATLPTDVWEGGIIFCKLCREILANNFVLSEVTDLNRNVLFEHGYAIAVRRHGLLLRDRSKAPQEFPLLKDVEQVYYENRSDILSHVTRFEIDDTDERRRPLRLIGMCQTCQIDPRYNLIYFLKNGSRSDAVRAIEKLLRKDKIFDVIDDNPNDIGGHEVHQYCKRIQQARYVVAHFVSDERRDHHLVNARVAFLMGLAVGFGKRVLIMQETPAAKKMIDLRGVIREYDRESQLRATVEEWLLGLRQYVVNYMELERRAARPRKRRLVRLRDLDLGPLAAEKDFDLPKYFIQTPYYTRAQRGDRTLFVGRRGSGKTAMFIALANDLASPNSVVAQIAPRNYELLRLEGFLAEGFSTAHWRFVYGSIWRNVLLGEIVRSVIDYQERHADLPVTDALEHLMRFHRENQDLLNLSFMDRLTLAIEDLQRLTPRTGTGENQKQVEATLKSIRFQQVEPIVKQFVGERKVYVLIDHLDESWSTDNEETCLLLAALIHEADRLNTYMTPGLRIVVFLRSDIFDVVKLRDSEIDKRSKVTMQWTRPLLKEMIATRIASAKALDIADRGVDETWCDVFCAKVGDKDTADYILDRTLLRPRDVLQFCNRCLEQGQNERHDYVHEDDILAAELSYSEDFILDLFREYHISHPDLIEVLWLFTGFPEEVEEARIAQLLQAAQADPRSVKTAATWLADYTPDRLIGFLYDIGFLCVKRGDGHFVGSCDTSLENATLNGLHAVNQRARSPNLFAGRLAAATEWLMRLLHHRDRAARQQRVLCVHPAFRRHLRIGSA
ncbi:MAG TPA: hypothetical protein VMW58_15490 [Anaerolineae bacterium]|nr:hypothetical protein [Anaerolineae bacterium]